MGTRLKVGLVLVLPILATAVVVGNRLADGLDTGRDLDRAGALATAVRAGGDLVESLQDERAAAVKLQGAMAQTARSRQQAAYRQAWSEVDRAATDYAAGRGPLTGLPGDVVTRLARVDEGLRGLTEVRSAVGRASLAVTDVARAYTALVDDLLRVRDDAAARVADHALASRLRAAAALAREKEQVSQGRLVVLHAYVAGALNANLQKEFIAAQSRRLQSVETFAAVATEAEQERYDRTVTGTSLRTTAAFEGWILGAMPPTGNLATAPFTIDTWDAAQREHGRLIRAVEEGLDADAVAAVTTARADGRRGLLLWTGVPLVLLLLAVLFAWWVARSMSRPRGEPPADAGDTTGPVTPDRPLATTGDRPAG
ncbi:nitrate- and nitrite sensing domain-containing protein [Asanoa sp. WMMD1127]|uniref:nitrate- and nitrite sensing domain-containing protein n=1 Tax=Asanoa sp. WMMD1127 TaxID=3016107 RepID=UPI002416B91A|nr:nitrate- and nitrite sensing domain-containing protein [Asanoa sp. WMMD1127]MDG4827236.1 nitrate- and nitrite sensing domain-containing protein [Asanoa sp. WMMD1127]